MASGVSRHGRRQTERISAPHVSLTAADGAAAMAACSEMSTLKAWAALDTASAADEENGERSASQLPPFYGVATTVGGPVFRHVTVKDDLDIVALEGEIVKSLRF